MTDREKTLKGLECLITNEVPCEGCPYMGSGYCLMNIAKDAKELLKEQEAVVPIIIDHTVFGTSRKCSKCNQYLFPAGKYCPHCGRSVKWE